MSALPESSTHGVVLHRRLVEASFAAVLAGLVVHRLWGALSPSRVLDSLVLALLWAGLATLVARVGRWRAPLVVAGIGVALLAVMAGPMPVLATLLLAVGAVALGSMLAGAPVPALVVGLAVIAGITGWLLPWPLHRAVVYAPVLLGLALLRRRALASMGRDAWAGLRGAIDAAPRASWLALIALALASTPAWLPTLQYDDLAYHLGLPSQLARHARYVPDVAQQVWSYAPWAGDVVQAVAQVLAGAEARGPVDVLWLAAGAALVADVAGRLGASPAIRWAAVALYATLPPVVALTGGMQTELPAAVDMLALATLALSPVTPRSPLAVGALAGLLMGLKLLHPVAGAGVVAWALLHVLRGSDIAARVHRARGIAIGVGAVVVALIVGGSSYVQAWRACGNPVLPLLNGYFRSPCFTPVDFADMRWQAVAGVPMPWSMTFMTSRHLEAFDGGLGFLLIGLAGAAVAALLDRRTRAAALAAVVAIAVPMATIPYARYVVPGIVLLIPPAVVAIARCMPERRALALLAALCVLDAAFVANAQWMLRTGAVKRALQAAGGDAELFARYAPERIAIARIRRLDPAATVLDLGGASHAELAGQGLTTLWYAPAMNAQAAGADADSTGAGWARLLRASGARFVLLRTPDATPARRAGLAHAGAHRVLTEGPVECWALPPAGPR